MACLPHSHIRPGTPGSGISSMPPSRLRPDHQPPAAAAGGSVDIRPTLSTAPMARDEDGAMSECIVDVIGFDHIVLRCADVERSLAWYTGALGMAEVRV